MEKYHYGVKVAKSLSGAAMSPTTITSTVVVMGSLKIKILMRESHLGNQIGWMWLVDAEKWFER